MYAKITSTQWNPSEPGMPVVSTLENGQTFRHEKDCEHPLMCECYVSRMRLVETPLGEPVATPEPDHGAYSLHLYRKYEQVQRQNTLLWIGLALSATVGCVALFGLVSELGLA